MGKSGQCTLSIKIQSRTRFCPAPGSILSKIVFLNSYVRNFYSPANPLQTARPSQRAPRGVRSAHRRRHRDRGPPQDPAPDVPVASACCSQSRHNRLELEHRLGRRGLKYLSFHRLGASFKDYATEPVVKFSAKGRRAVFSDIALRHDINIVKTSRYCISKISR